MSEIHKIDRGPHRILLIEDRPSLQLAMKMAFEANQYLVECHESAESAWDRLQAKPSFHTVITDVILPGLNGDELLRKIRSVDVQTTVFLMSGHRQDFFDSVLGQSDTNTFFFQKPFRIQEMLDTLSRINRIEAA
ncbi:MAG: response regulator [Planctomycetota bacterium]